MSVKTTITDSECLEEVLNEIGWENVLQILPRHKYNDTLFVVIYVPKQEQEPEPITIDWNNPTF